MAKLRTTVHVDGVQHGPGEVSADVAARISNPKVWDGDPPANAGTAVPDQRKIATQPDAVAPPPAPTPSADGKPSGKPSGSASRAEWAAFASSRGASAEEVAEGGLTRDELRDKYGQ